MWSSVWTRRINYLTLIVFVGFGLLFYHHYALMIMMAVIIVAPVISYIVTKKSINRFHITVSSDKMTIGKNVPVEVYFNVDNKSLVPVENLTLKVKFFNYFYDNDENYEVIVGAVPRQKRQVKMSVTGIYCGRMQVVLEQAVIYDFFCMFKFVTEIAGVVDIDIMPTKSRRFENVALSSLGVSEDEQIQTKKGDDVSQISEIRNYIPGDKLQNIHWKLSAKNEELQVKEFSLPYSEDVVIVVEMYADRENPQIFDELVEILYAFSRDLLMQGRKFNMVWKASEYELKSMEIYHDDDLNAAIRELFFVKLQEKNGETYDLYTSLYQEIKGTVLYISNANAAVKNGEKLDIGSERVMLTWLW